MPLTTEQIIRSRINDPYRYGTEIIMGDGTASAYQLKQGSPYSTISAGSFTASTAAGGTAWSATGCSIDVTAGRVIFSAVVPANVGLQCDYSWSVFSIDEMAYFMTLGGVPEATLGAVNHMLVNYAKRARWAAPDGSTVDDTMALNSLLALRSALDSEIRGADLGPMGEFNTWSETQGDYY